MPGRYIREGKLTSERVDKLSVYAEVYFDRLMLKVDDYGRIQKHPTLLRAALFPLRLDRVSDQDIERWNQECEDAGLLEAFTDLNGKLCIEIGKFNQRVRSESRFPRKADGSPLPDKCLTHDGQMHSSPNTSPSPRTNNLITSNESELSAGAISILEQSIGTGDDSKIALNRENPLDSLRKIVGEKEWKQNGKMWMKRCEKLTGRQALIFALEDYVVKTPEERAKIENPASYLTARFKAHGGKSVANVA